MSFNLCLIFVAVELLLNLNNVVSTPSFMHNKFVYDRHKGNIKFIFDFMEKFFLFLFKYIEARRT